LAKDDDGEEDDLAASLSLPLRRRPEADGEPSVPAPFARRRPRSTRKSEDPTAEQEYSSLLAMKNPFRKEAEEFVRVDEPEPDENDIEATVTFPERKATAEPHPLSQPAHSTGPLRSAQRA
jgi:hypothetical protein